MCWIEIVIVFAFREETQLFLQWEYSFFDTCMQQRLKTKREMPQSCCVCEQNLLASGFSYGAGKIDYLL